MYVFSEENFRQKAINNDILSEFRTLGSFFFSDKFERLRAICRKNPKSVYYLQKYNKKLILNISYGKKDKLSENSR